MTDAGLQYGSVVNYASIIIKSSLTKLPFCPPCDQFNKDLNNLEFKHLNKPHSPPSPLCLLAEQKLTSHWTGPEIMLSVYFYWQDCLLNSSESRKTSNGFTLPQEEKKCQKWRWVPIPKYNTKSYTWLQKLTHMMPKRSKIEHYWYWIPYQFSPHNRMLSTSHYRILHERKLVARISPSAIQNKRYFQLDNLQSTPT